MSPPALDHTGLTVSAMERSLAFWRDALGMEVVMDEPRDARFLADITGEAGARGRVVLLRFPDAPAHMIELWEYAAPAGGAARLRPADVGFAHVAVRCPDVDALLARLAGAGGAPVSPPVEVTAGPRAGWRAVYVRDPDGHVLELVGSSVD